MWSQWVRRQGLGLGAIQGRVIFARQTLLLNGARVRVYADEVRGIVDIVTRYFSGCMVQLHTPADGQAHIVVRSYYSVLFSRGALRIVVSGGLHCWMTGTYIGSTLFQVELRALAVLKGSDRWMEGDIPLTCYSVQPYGGGRHANNWVPL